MRIHLNEHGGVFVMWCMPTARGMRLLLGLGLISGTVSTPAADAAIVAVDFALPVWQGTPNGVAGAGHQIDCTSINHYDYASACTVDIRTVISGANCVIEAISSPAVVTVATAVPNTPCTATLRGPLLYTETAGGCVFAGPALWMSWVSGVSSQPFSATAPVSGHLVPTSSAANWLLVVRSYPTPSGAGHILTVQETFRVRFNRSVTTCPSEDLTNLKANVHDASPNSSITGSDGFIKDTVAS